MTVAPHSAETTGNVAPPQKHIKISAKKGEKQIHVISSQSTRATTSSVFLSSLVVYVSPTMSQATVVQPITQTTVVVEPVVIPVVEELVTPELAIALADVSPVAVTLEKTTTTTKRNLPPNLKKIPIIILEKKV